MRAIVKHNKKLDLRVADTAAAFFIRVPLCEPTYFVSQQPTINKLYIVGAAVEAEGSL